MVDQQRAKIEWLKCSENPTYFINEYCYIYNATDRDWIPFDLWAAQHRTLADLMDNRLIIILKARQLGLSWLVLCYSLWVMLFQPAATILLFSKRDEEAIELLSFRLKGIYQRLPEWMQAAAVGVDGKHDWHLSNGSSAKAFPTTGGRSYTGSVVIVDEADFVQDLDALLNAVKPTVDAGGQMIMLSTVDKSQPNSAFKRIYRGGKKKLTDWKAIFLAWSVRPGRDEKWYETQKADIMMRTGSLDDLHQEYPATDTEALAPRSLDKRIAPGWIEQCFGEMEPLTDENAPAIHGLEIYRKPETGRRYVIGVDPAEGNPTSDDSALTVIDALSGEEVAALSGKFQPSTIGAHTDEVGTYYNNADVMCERNNHGHAVLLWLYEHSSLRLLASHDGRAGWLSSALGKVLLYNNAADCFREKSTTLHSFDSYTQLASIEGSSLRAPDGEHDDRADSYALALAGAYRAFEESPDELVVYEEELSISPY